MQDAVEVQDNLPEEAQAVITKGKKKTSTLSGNLILDIAAEVEGLTKTKALHLAITLADNIDTNYFKLGGVLSLIYENAWFDGFESFDQFVYEKFGFQVRKAKYLMEIYQHLVDNQIPWEKVHHLGWTKLKDLARFLTLDNLDEWIKKAEHLTVVELQAMLKGADEGGEKQSSETQDDVATLKFKLKHDQLETIKSALNKAKAEAQTDFDNVALEMICMGYLGGVSQSSSTSDSTDLVDLMRTAGPEVVLGIFDKLFPEVELQVL